MMESWQKPHTHRIKCQFCKQMQDCRRGPDPFLFYNFDEIEMVWLCSECHFIRKHGLHLAHLDEDEV